jgi:hypothetical protein
MKTIYTVVCEKTSCTGDISVDALGSFTSRGWAIKFCTSAVMHLIGSDEFFRIDFFEDRNHAEMRGKNGAEPSEIAAFVSDAIGGDGGYCVKGEHAHSCTDFAILENGLI